MSDSDGGSPIQVALFALLLAGGGWYVYQHYLPNHETATPADSATSQSDDSNFVNFRDSPPLVANRSVAAQTTAVSANQADRRAAAYSVNRDDRADAPYSPSPREVIIRPQGKTSVTAPKAIPNIRIASWALDGFGPTKLGNPLCRRHLAQVIRQFDIVALQQIASIERDLIPRLVDVINNGGGHYDYVVGPSTGPKGRQEQLAFIFDTSRVRVDRRQTYTVEDPENQVTFDPLVAWFRTAEPPQSEAWTFSLVNVRVDLARAPGEVSLLAAMLKAIRNDGRGEDDVLLVGLFQADDAYLLPSLSVRNLEATVAGRPTDIFGRYQTSNVLVDTKPTREYVGRGGVFQYLQEYDINLLEAETVTSHLPVYGEFTATEGGQLK